MRICLLGFKVEIPGADNSVTPTSVSAKKGLALLKSPHEPGGGKRTGWIYLRQKRGRLPRVYVRLASLREARLWSLVSDLSYSSPDWYLSDGNKP